MATQEDFDFESFKKEAIADLYAGKKMTGANDGTLSRIDDYRRAGAPHFRK